MPWRAKNIVSLGLSFLLRMGNWGLSPCDFTLGSSRVPLGFLVGRPNNSQLFCEWGWITLRIGRQ